MGSTTFSGPVTSQNGFIGDIVGNVTATSITSSGQILAQRASTSTAQGVATRGLSGILQPSASFGSSNNQAPSSAQGAAGQVAGSNQTSTATYYVGVMGRYLITGTNASTFPKVGVLGVVGNVTTTADAAVMAFMDGDGGLTTARCGFGISMTNSTNGSGFTYGLDLVMQDTGVAGSIQPYGTAEVRLAEDGANDPVCIKTGTFTDGTASGLGIGSLGLDTTNGKLFVVDSSGDWQEVALVP